MNTKTKTGPLFKNVEEFHLALVDYAKQALAQTIAITTAPGYDGSKRTMQEVFADEAMERLAQISGFVWMDHEKNVEEAKNGGARIQVDGIPLSSLEEAIYGASFVRGPEGSSPYGSHAHAARMVRYSRLPQDPPR
jgi:hypothetical protein